MTSEPRQACVLLDIGKTNAKLALVDAAGVSLASARMSNEIVAHGSYPHHDTERIWDWLLTTLRRFAPLAQIAAIVPVTHGATAALVDANGLVLPVPDYESALPQQCDEAYRALRPPFSASFSPDLPAGLNLGRQLFWLARSFPEAFPRARHLLMYPQYWAWRLCGVAAAEVSSLGCHTDLWAPPRGDYSALVDAMGWRALLPPMRRAWEPLAPLLPALVAATGLPASCQVLCGIHDSNAALLRYLERTGGEGAPRTVLSTGTWVIAAALGRPLSGLDERADMLANVDALGDPVACMRFMGGREFSWLAGEAPQVCDVAELETIVAQGTLALPCFAESGGPFVGRAGAIVGPAPRGAAQRYALATLYCALMTDYCMERLEAAGDIVIEGSFTGNPHFAPLLAALRTPQPVGLSDDASGSSHGAALLWRWNEVSAEGSPPRAVAPLALAGLAGYRERWRAALPPVAA